MRFFPRTRFGVAWRALVAGLLVTGLAAGATATYGLLKVSDFVGLLNHTKALQNTGVTLPQPGKPETLLLVGSDHRFGQGSGESNTDTMMLVRIDDSSSTINMLSIPRDLAVQINGTTQKLNAAWSDGGPKLLIHTLQSQVFPGLRVNHILNIDFQGFAALINSIGCVYSMVDHRYYNQSEGALNPETNFSSIDIQPGYQRLCGGAGNSGGASSALAFVRFRHSDSDLMREARQQDFLRWAKAQFTTSGLAHNEQRLINIFADHVSSDKFLHTTDGLIDLFDLAINANGHQVKSFQFPVTDYPVIGGADYVASTLTATERVYKRFMTPTVASSGSSSGSAPKHHSGKGKPHSTVLKIPGGMSADPSDGISQARELGAISFPVYYPKYTPTNAFYCFSTATHTGSNNDCALGFEPASAYEHSYPRRYHIRGHGSHAAYVMTLSLSNVQDGYVNVQGTTWQTPPLLRSPTKVQTIDGKKLDEYYNGGGNLSVVAWHTKQAVYWISNTLEDDLPPSQMIAMAATLTPAP